jgi:transcriptional antiterminator RfaH
VRLVDGAFAGLEGVFQLAEGERRVMVLIELLSRPVLVPVDPGSLRRVG